MPQVLSDPSLNPGVITNGGTDLFAFPNVQQPSVLGLQVPPTQPLPPGGSTATNLLSPDLQIAAQLRNFPPNVYDLSPTSLLVHFMQAALGAGGSGQLRMRQLVARLQQAVTSTRFYDLDSFYGALFGAQRGPSGTLPANPATGLPFNPYTDLASPDAWDQIEAIDAQYRERIIQLARAITLGGTVPGMQALAEAVSGVPCLIYETWRLLDNAEGPAPGFQTWEEVETTYPTWSAIPAAQTWQSVEGVVTYAGLLGSGVPTEIVIQPKKNYTSSVADQIQQGADMFGILSVVEVLKPATTLVSVDTTGPGIVLPVQIAAAWADSEYQEIVHLVTPVNSSAPAYAAITGSYQGVNAGQTQAGTYVQPSPPMTRSSGSQYSYAGDVTAVTATAATGDDPNAAVVTDGHDIQTIVFFGSGAVQYTAPQAVMPARQAATVRTSSAVAVQSAPYSGPRVPVARAS
jgi:hypothetical protein